MIAKQLREAVDRKLAVTFALVLAAMFLAAFWPLDPFPENGAGWSERQGLRFVNDGVAVSNGALTPAGGPGIADCSVELSMRPAINQGPSAILDFFQADGSKELAILQEGNHALIVSKSDFRRSYFRWQHPFRTDESTLVTMTADVQGTRVYFDAVPAEKIAGVRILNDDCSGRIVLGTRAQSRATWNGDLLGIAIYHRRLTPSEIRDHYQAWDRQDSAALEGTEGLVALYRFRERSGRVTHSEVVGGPRLDIPTTFRIPYHPFLRAPWTEFRKDGVDWQDLTLNVFGFVPFGFCAFSLLLSTRHSRRAVLITMIVGALVSLAFEVVQWYIPSRHSSMTDVITNVTGTGLGVISHWLVMRAAR